MKARRKGNKVGFPAKPPFERFSRHFLVDDGCWLWVGALTRKGYGYFYLRPGKSVNAHRFAYESMVGPIPEGWEIDHLCSVRNCVRPDHLEAVTHQENVRRARSVADSA